MLESCANEYQFEYLNVGRANNEIARQQSPVDLAGMLSMQQSDQQQGDLVMPKNWKFAL